MKQIYKKLLVTSMLLHDILYSVKSPYISKAVVLLAHYSKGVSSYTIQKITKEYKGKLKKIKIPDFTAEEVQFMVCDLIMKIVNLHEEGNYKAVGALTTICTAYSEGIEAVASEDKVFTKVDEMLRILEVA